MAIYSNEDTGGAKSREEYLNMLGLSPGMDISSYDPVFASLPSDPNWESNLSASPNYRSSLTSGNEEGQQEIDPNQVTIGGRTYLTNADAYASSGYKVPEDAYKTVNGVRYIDAQKFLLANPQLTGGGSLSNFLTKMPLFMGAAFGGAAAAGAIPSAGAAAAVAPAAAGGVAPGTLSMFGGAPEMFGGAAAAADAATLPSLLSGSGALTAGAGGTGVLGAGGALGGFTAAQLAAAGLETGLPFAPAGGALPAPTTTPSLPDLPPSPPGTPPGTPPTTPDYPMPPPSDPVPTNPASQTPFPNIPTPPPGTGSVIDRILNGTATASDWASILGNVAGVAGPAIGTYLGANNMSDTLMDIYNQQRADRAPALAAYNNALNNPDSFYSSAPAMGAADAFMRTLNVHGNPANNPGMAAYGAANSLGGYNSYLNSLSGPAFGGQGTQAQLGTAAAGAEGGQYAGLGYGLSNLLSQSQQPTPQDLSRYGITIGGVNYGGSNNGGR